MTSKQQQWRVPLKTFFDISFKADQIDKGFEADFPEKMTAAYPCMRFSDKYLVACQYFFNQIAVWESLKIDMLLLFFQANCFKPHANLISFEGNIKESLT